jgi:hypothetical protein
MRLAKPLTLSGQILPPMAKCAQLAFEPKFSDSIHSVSWFVRIILHHLAMVTRNRYKQARVNS